MIDVGDFGERVARLFDMLDPYLESTGWVLTAEAIRVGAPSGWANYCPICERSGPCRSACPLDGLREVTP